MSDDWNINKGKRYTFAGGETLSVHKKCIMYPDETLETLRQKLIEDYIYLAKHPNWLNNQEKDFIDQINKRFEVKHDKK